jgi:hypothetical protein
VAGLLADAAPDSMAGLLADAAANSVSYRVAIADEME